jgi:lysophospholipase L1-like esterase
MKKKVFLLITLFVFCVSIPMTAQSRRDLWFVGDGTMATYGADSTEARGWVQMLEQYLSPKVKLTNDAKLGISAKVFMDNQGMKQLAKQSARTILFLQLGTNDLKEYSQAQYSAPDAFIRRVQEIIAAAYKNKVNVLLCTPLAQPYYKEGVLIDRLGSYTEMIRHIAAYNHIGLLDLEQTTREWLQGMTEQEAAKYYVTLDENALANGEYQLNEEGATVVAGMVRDAIVNTNSKKLKKILKK